MNALSKVKQLLEQSKTEYELLEHQLTYTSLETAEAQHVPGRQMIKTVIVDADGTFLMCVLPSTHKIDFLKLQTVTGAKNIQLADEGAVATLFPGFDLGGMPPFGQLAGLKVYADRDLEENEEIYFNAGTHTDVIRIKSENFVRLAQPTFADFGRHI